MAIERQVWQDEIGRGDPSDYTTWDAIDITREAEAVQATGSRQRGNEQSFAAVYPLKDGSWAFYHSTPRTRGRSWYVSADQAACRNAARHLGEGTRLGIGDTPEVRAR